MAWGVDFHPKENFFYRITRFKIKQNTEFLGETGITVSWGMDPALML